MPVHDLSFSCLILVMKNIQAADLSRIVEMAWEDRTPFEAIEAQFKMSEAEVKALMRKSLKRSSYELWRKRVNGRQTKHHALRDPSIQRAYCPTQYKTKSDK